MSSSLVVVIEDTSRRGSCSPFRFQRQPFCDDATLGPASPSLNRTLWFASVGSLRAATSGEKIARAPLSG